jgi:crossover junction endodeoxyribonuclease RuvC
MVILGIDPGTATTGFGLVRTLDKDVEVMDWGLIETDKEGTTGKRLQSIFFQITEILKKQKPSVMAIEKIFFATNAKTAIGVGQATGVMILAATNTKVPVFEYAPGTIKKMVAGDGRADKKMVQKSVRVILGNKVRSKAKKRTHFDNAADALAVALCHAIKTCGSMIGGEK